MPRTYGADEGEEIAPGVRLIELGKRDSNIGAYKTIEMVDMLMRARMISPDFELTEMLHRLVSPIPCPTRSRRFATISPRRWISGIG